MLGRQLQGFARVLALLQRSELLLGIGQLGLQGLFLLTELDLGLTLNGVHHLERPGKTTARAHADQCFGTGQVVQGVDRETGVVRPGLRNTLTEEVLHLHPHAVGEHVGVGHDDHVDVVGLFEAILLPFDPLWESRLRRAADTRGQGVTLAGGFEFADQFFRVGQHAEAFDIKRHGVLRAAHQRDELGFRAVQRLQHAGGGHRDGFQ